MIHNPHSQLSLHLPNVLYLFNIQEKVSTILELKGNRVKITSCRATVIPTCQGAGKARYLPVFDLSFG